jgi:hypothetical protein
VPETYPWYEVAAGPNLAQGDFLDRCPILVPPPDLELTAFAPGAATEIRVGWRDFDVDVVTQSCDLEQDKVDLVLVCPHWSLEELGEQNAFFRSSRGKEELRRGNVTGCHMLAPCGLPSFEREIRVVEFRTVLSVPHALLKHLAVQRGSRLHLLSPYREHLSQALARFFMRVGLPVDLPPFR